MMEIYVECYAGYRADERPVRFTFLTGRAHAEGDSRSGSGERVFEVVEIEDRWYSPGATYFRVRADDGNFYVLRHEQGIDAWTLDAFRAARDSSGATPPPLDPTTSVGPHGPS